MATEDIEKTEETQDQQKKSLMDNFGDWVGKTKDFLISAWYKLQNLEHTNMELGVRHMKIGNYNDAIIRFKFVLLMNKNNDIAHYFLGKAYTYAGKKEKAIPELNIALAKNPEMEEAKFLLRLCGVKQDIDRIPHSLLIEHLDMVAFLYENDIETKGTKKLNSCIKEMFNEYLGDKQGYEVLDIDCRAGESGDIIYHKSNHIIGVEPSLKLLGMARTKRIDDRLVYHRLINQMGIDYLKSNEAKYDIIIATYMALNQGKLDDFFELSAHALKPKGLLTFNVDLHNGKDYTFRPENMGFAHSENYVKELSEKNSFKIISEKIVEYNSGAKDLVFLMERK